MTSTTMLDSVPDAETLRIGSLASRTGVSVEALRYYEKRGLVRPVGRRGSGYREYGADSVRVVLFIKPAHGASVSARRGARPRGTRGGAAKGAGNRDRHRIGKARCGQPAGDSPPARGTPAIAGARNIT